jgi:hypothetical protein
MTPAILTYEPYESDVVIVTHLLLTWLPGGQQRTGRSADL